MAKDLSVRWALRSFAINTSALAVGRIQVVAVTLLNIRTYSLVLGSTFVRSGRDVVVNVGLTDHDVVRCGPTHTLVDLVSDTILGSVMVFGNSSVIRSQFNSRYIDNL
jgi:hypothetical protein